MSESSDAARWGAWVMALARRIGPLLLGGLVVAGVALAGFGMLADEMMEGDTARFDSAVRGAVHSVASPGLTSVMRAVSALGGPIGFSVILGGLVAIFLLHRWYRGAALLVASLAGALLLQLVLKLAFRRPRPAAFFGYPEPVSYSFPSGHALVSFCVLMVLAGLAAPRLKHPALRAAVATAALALALLVGLSRIYLGVHYPSDVLGGYAAGLVWVVTILAADRWIMGRRDPPA